jgi:Holliday junction resolvase-like predicted endonuclease
MEEVISEIKWIELGEALESVTYKNDRNLINAARRFLTEREQRNGVQS